MTRQTQAALSRIPIGVWVLGFVSMLMDISSEMIHSLLPLFMVQVLGTGMVAVGLIEGLAESMALIVKIFSGTLSDYLGKRKGLAVCGYALGALSKPLFALAKESGVRPEMRWSPASRRFSCAGRHSGCANPSIRWAHFLVRCWRSL